MGGGSTTVEGPKNEGTSPDVVTGVLRSPGWVSDGGGSSTAEQAAAGTGLPPLSTEILLVLYRHVSKLSTLKWCAAAADSVNKKAEAWWWWWCCAGSVSRPSMIMVAGGLGRLASSGPPTTVQTGLEVPARTAWCSSPLVAGVSGWYKTPEASYRNARPESGSTPERGQGCGLGFGSARPTRLNATLKLVASGACLYFYEWSICSIFGSRSQGLRPIGTRGWLSPLHTLPHHRSNVMWRRDDATRRLDMDWTSVRF